MNRITLLFATILSISASAQQHDWENEQLTQINKEKPHATLYYDDQNQGVTLLNWVWDFFFY